MAHFEVEKKNKNKKKIFPEDVIPLAVK